MFGAVLALLLSGFKTSYRGEPVTLHCEVSPTAWKRYVTSHVTIDEGVWFFLTEDNVEVTAGNCIREVQR